MGTFALTNATVFAGAIDLGSSLNKVTVNTKADELDDTRFGMTAHSRVGGLKDFSIAHDGYVQYADPDATIFAGLSVQRVVSVSPTGADGATAYFGNATRFDYTPLDGTVGELAAFSGNVLASDQVGLVRGQLLLPKQTVTGTGATGTGQQLGLVGATQYLYTAIHCFAAGTTATVIVESDDNSGFSSAVTRSSTVVTAVGGTFVTRVGGAIASDTYWRVRVASVTGTFSLAVAVGIQ